MATIRRRSWTTASGEPREAWVADYHDGAGKRRLKTFARKGEAKDWLAQVQVDVKAGEHVADRASVTVAQAAESWLETCRHGRPDDANGGLEASTVREYERHVRYITEPAIGIGQSKLNQLSKVMVEAFLKRLRDAGRSASMARKVRTSLSSLIGHAQERGQVGRNVLRDERRRGRGQRETKEVVVPSKAELVAMLDRAAPLWFNAFITLAIYTGMRASELRGLPWRHVDLTAGLIRVRQRADFAGRISAPKSRAGNRDLIMTPAVRSILSEWKLQSRPGAELVFETAPQLDENGKLIAGGKPHSHANIVQRHFNPLQATAGLVGPKLDIDGKPVLDRHGRPRLLYGLHELRHAAASLFIEQNWTPKKVQVIMGHSSIQVTFDVYGKLFRNDDDDQAAMAAVEASLRG